MGWSRSQALAHCRAPAGGRFSAVAGDRAIVVTIDRDDPSNPHGVTVAVNADGVPWLRGAMPQSGVMIK